MGATEDYLRSGGIAGYARNCLNDELNKASKNKKHPLRAIHEARKRGEKEEAINQLLTAILIDLKTPENNRNWRAIQVIYGTLPRADTAINAVAEQGEEGNYEPMQNLPPEMIFMGGLEAQARHDKPKVDLGNMWSENQQKFAGKRHDESHEKHAQWQQWQAEAIAENPLFADKSKREQATLLKKKHAIAYPVDTIRKRLKSSRLKIVGNQPKRAN
jgi:hypothetical protein